MSADTAYGNFSEKFLVFGKIFEKTLDKPEIM